MICSFIDGQHVLGNVKPESRQAISSHPQQSRLKTFPWSPSYSNDHTNISLKPTYLIVKSCSPSLESIRSIIFFSSTPDIQKRQCLQIPVYTPVYAALMWECGSSPGRANALCVVGRGACMKQLVWRMSEDEHMEANRRKAGTRSNMSVNGCSGSVKLGNLN